MCSGEPKSICPGRIPTVKHLFPYAQAQASRPGDSEVRNSVAVDAQRLQQRCRQTRLCSGVCRSTKGQSLPWRDPHNQVLLSACSSTGERARGLRGGQCCWCRCLERLQRCPEIRLCSGVLRFRRRGSLCPGRILTVKSCKAHAQAQASGPGDLEVGTAVIVDAWSFFSGALKPECVQG